MVLNLRSLALSTAAVFFLNLPTASAIAQVARSNYDVDADGLLEIRSVDDFLAIQNSFGVAKLNGESSGCPVGGCIGYELVADLDFSAFPSTQVFPSPSLYTIVFEGNNHVIQNLSATRFAGNDGGLFSAIHDSVVRNLRLENIRFDHSPVTYLGGIAGLAVDCYLVNVQVSGALRGAHYTGGLLGVGNNCTVIASSFSGVIDPIHVGGGLGKGGLVGNGETMTVYASSAQGRFESSQTLTSNTELGGIIGTTHSTNRILASYAHFGNQAVSMIGNITATTVGHFIQSSYVTGDVTRDTDAQAVVISYYARPNLQAPLISQTETVALEDLRCPQSEQDRRCNFPGLFSGWQLHEDSVGQGVWDFGSSTDLPRIRSGLVFQLEDADKDGVVDVADDLPLDAAASDDLDRDAKPDRWNPGCDEICQQMSGLELDDVIERPLQPEPEPEPVKGGSLSLFELLLAMASLAILAKWRRF